MITLDEQRLEQLFGILERVLDVLAKQERQLDELTEFLPALSVLLEGIPTLKAILNDSELRAALDDEAALALQNLRAKIHPN